MGGTSSLTEGVEGWLGVTGQISHIEAQSATARGPDAANRITECTVRGTVANAVAWSRPATGAVGLYLQRSSQHPQQVILRVDGKPRATAGKSALSMAAGRLNGMNGDDEQLLRGCVYAMCRFGASGWVSVAACQRAFGWLTP
ncbi:hypothetical protein GCM10020367_68790 [Streptomyces sannanensis]|uniref:ATP-binding protein n=1 Tax=Streptomyces sannanensis TaxID=285536 RepID=A0ABP6SM91_9ACTN